MPEKLTHIAVNTRFLLKGGLEGMGRFTYEILNRLVNAHPDVKFSFFFDRPFDSRYIFGENVEAHVLFPPARHPFLFYLWFDWAVACKLKKLKPDLFFSPDGFLCRRTSVPQIPVFHDLAFMHFPEDVKKMEAWYYHKFFPDFSKKAAHIIAVSEYTRQDIIQQFGRPESEISVVYNACSDRFHPIGEQEKTKIRIRYAGGQPYFHFVGAIHPRKNLNTLIQAFDLFKQSTGLPHKLLVVGRKAWDFENVIHSYRESSFKSDILFTGFVPDEELNALYAASEALCYVPYFEGFGIPIVEAMNSETAVICSNVSSMPEVAAGAALLTDPRDAAGIAAAMRRITNEDGLREKLIQKGRHRRNAFDWDQSAEKVWKIMLSTCFSPDQKS